MASTINIQLKSELTQAQAQRLTRLGNDKDREGVQSIINLLKAIKGRQTRATVYVATGSAAPVAASGTWTLASVVDTDAVTLAGVVLTFTSSASLETDVNVTVASAKAFASATDISLLTGVITETGHGYLTGDVGRLTTSGSLPTGFALSTDYHVIKVDADHYKLASSQANALAGTAIIPTAAGSGNQTFTPVSDKCLAYRLAAAVNAHSTLQYAFTASAALDVVTVTAKVKGVVGNFIAFTDQDSTITSSGSGYLAGGTGGSMEDAQTYDCGL